jgi:outer membrane protein assembly factor BamB
MRNVVRSLLVCALILQACAADWPAFRGPNRNGVVSQKLELLPDGPKKLWETAVGHGNGSIAVVDGRLYTMARQPENSVVCLDANTGDRVWLCPVKTWSRDPTPAVESNRVYVFASEDKPRAYCVDAKTGRLLWERVLPKPTGDRQYGHAGSPLLWQDLIVLNAGGGAALNKQSGEVVWQHEGFPGLATPVLFHWKGKPCVAIFGGDQLIAREARGGQELFRIPWKTSLAVNAADPIIMEEKIFLCSDYGLGRALYDFSNGPPKPVWEFGKGEGHAYSSGFLLEGHLYCFTANHFVSLDLATGQPRWRREGSGSAIVIGDKVVRVRSRGEFEVAQISPQNYTRLQSANLGLTDIKNVPAYSEGRLFVRNEKGILACWQIGK